MNYIKQIYSEFRQQPMAVWLSVGGTALAIFLVMIVFVVSEVPRIEAKPESCRRSLMIGEGIHLIEGNNEISTTYLSEKWAEKFYGSLDGIEKMALFSDLVDEDVSEPGKLSTSLTVRPADYRYWSIFDFEFTQGKPYTREQSDANMNVVVLSEKAARTIFGTTKDIVGRDIMLRQTPYRVTGVVRNVNPLFSFASGDIYTPIDQTPSIYKNSWMDDFIGANRILLVKKSGVSDEAIKHQVKDRYDKVNAMLRLEGRGIEYHETPYNMEEVITDHGSNETPDATSARRIHLIIYVVLLLLPAINLSGMSRSRLTHRISEIGVRRAFGATRLSIVGQLLTENLLITIIGGVLGLILSAIFIMLFSNLFVDLSTSWTVSDDLISATPSLSMIVSMRVFGFAMLFCFMLNLLSAGFPVLKAASVNPAIAISKK